VASFAGPPPTLEAIHLHAAGQVRAGPKASRSLSASLCYPIGSDCTADKKRELRYLPSNSLGEEGCLIQTGTRAPYSDSRRTTSASKPRSPPWRKAKMRIAMLRRAAFAGPVFVRGWRAQSSSSVLARERSDEAIQAKRLRLSSRSVTAVHQLRQAIELNADYEPQAPNGCSKMLMRFKSVIPMMLYVSVDRDGATAHAAIEPMTLSRVRSDLVRSPIRSLPRSARASS
jgi:hypothetical protein